MQSVTIEAMDDGRFCVKPGMEAGEMPEMPEAGPEGSPMDMKQDAAEGEAENYCDTLDEALAMAGEMLAGGAAPSEKPAPMMDGEAEFLAGFKQASGTPL